MSARDELDDLCQRLNTAFDAAGVEVADKYDDAIRALAAERDKARREYVECQTQLTIANTTQRNLHDHLRKIQNDPTHRRLSQRLVDLVEERDNAETALIEARRVLREVEWKGADPWGESCPCCFAAKYVSATHAADCALAAVLAQEEK